MLTWNAANDVTCNLYIDSLGIICSVAGRAQSCRMRIASARQFQIQSF